MISAESCPTYCRAFLGPKRESLNMNQMSIFSLSSAKVIALKAKLESEFIGKTSPGWSCCCGTLSRSDSTVVGAGFDGDGNKPWQWTLNLIDQEGKYWSCDPGTLFLGGYEKWQEIFVREML